MANFVIFHITDSTMNTARRYKRNVIKSMRSDLFLKYIKARSGKWVIEVLYNSGRLKVRNLRVLEGDLRVLHKCYISGYVSYRSVI